MSRLIVLVAALLATVGSAWAVCAPDTDGLEEASSFSDEERFTDGNLDATGARTQDDFIRATANDLFFADNGSWLAGRLRASTNLWNTSVFGTPAPRVLNGTACNDIGQCQTIQIMVQSVITTDSSMQEAAIRAALGSAAGGVVSLGLREFLPNTFTLTATAAAGQVSDPMDFIGSTILDVQSTGNGYSLSTDGQSLDTVCKDNEGNLIDEPSPPTNEPIGGGGDSGSGGSGGVGGGGDTGGGGSASRLGGGGTWDCWESGGVICKRL